MTDTQKKPLWKNELVWLFLLTSGLFAILYSKFILGGYAYVFTDTGADTMQINYAQYGLFSSLFRSGESGYVLQAGLGMDVSSYYPAYLIPYNLLILLAPQRLLPWAVLASAYLKMITISLVGYLFYRKLMQDGIRNYGSGARMDLFRLCDSLGTALRLLYLYGTVYSLYVFSSVLSEWRTALEKCRARDHGNDAADLQLLFPVHDCFFCCILCGYIQHNAEMLHQVCSRKNDWSWGNGNTRYTDRWDRSCADCRYIP